MAVKTEQPTVVLLIGTSAITFDEGGEVLEAELDEFGQPQWDDAGICDHRGGGGEEGFRLLQVALKAAEENARLVGFEVKRVQR